MLSFGVEESVTEIYDAQISDHFAVLFTIVLSQCYTKLCTPACLVRMIRRDTVPKFSAAFCDSLLSHSVMYGYLGPDYLLNLFIFTCTELLETIAPLEANAKSH